MSLIKPTAFGVSVIGFLVAALVFWFTGALWYGFLFSDIWLQEVMINRNLTTMETWQILDQQAKVAVFKEAYPESGSPTYMIVGFFNALVSVAGLSFVLSRLKAVNLASALGVSLLIAVCFGVTSLAYDHIYGLLPLKVFWIDAFHQVIAYMLAGVANYTIARQTH